MKLSTYCQLSTPSGLCCLMLPEQSITNAMSSRHPATRVITLQAHAHHTRETFIGIGLFNAQMLVITFISDIVVGPFLACLPILLGMLFRPVSILSVLANVNSRSRSLYAISRPSVVCRLSVCLSACLSVCNIRAPYSGGSNFRQYFYGIGYLGHPLTSTENFTEIVPWEHLRRGT